jgi:hypothetical protein
MDARIKTSAKAVLKFSKLSLMSVSDRVLSVISKIIRPIWSGLHWFTLRTRTEKRVVILAVGSVILAY